MVFYYFPTVFCNFFPIRIVFLIISVLVNIRLSIINIIIDPITIKAILSNIGTIYAMLKKFPRYVTPNIKRADIDRAISILNIEKGNIVSSFFLDLVRVNRRINPHILVAITHRLE